VLGGIIGPIGRSKAPGVFASDSKFQGFNLNQTNIIGGHENEKEFKFDVGIIAGIHAGGLR
jgi:hypothetical protein